MTVTRTMSASKGDDSKMARKYASVGIGPFAGQLAMKSVRVAESPSSLTDDDVAECDFGACSLT